MNFSPREGQSTSESRDREPQWKPHRRIIISQTLTHGFPEQSVARMIHDLHATLPHFGTQVVRRHRIGTWSYQSIYSRILPPDRSSIWSCFYSFGNMLPSCAAGLRPERPQSNNCHRSDRPGRRDGVVIRTTSIDSRPVRSNTLAKGRF